MLLALAVEHLGPGFDEYGPREEPHSHGCMTGKLVYTRSSRGFEFVVICESISKRMHLEDILCAIARRFRPELETLSELERVSGIGDIVGFLYSVPLVLVGAIWLVAVTDVDLILSEALMFLVLLGLALLFDRLRFFIFLDIKGLFVNAEGSLSSVAVWSGALLYGPSAIWLAVIAALAEFTREWRQRTTVEESWGRLRGLSLRLAAAIPFGLLALSLYQRLGGVFPIPDLSLNSIMPALVATLAWSVLALAIYLPFIVYVGLRAVQLTESSASIWSFMQAAIVGVALPALSAPFGILAAGVYAQNGLAVFLLFMGGLLMGSLMARQLSQAIERSQQRSRELEMLEQLGHAILSAPPDASALSELLQQHVPGMFPSSRIEIRRFPDQVLARFPHSDDWLSVPQPVWAWVRTASQARFIPPDVTPPWGGQPTGEPLVVAPVIDTETSKPIGGICVAPRRGTTDVASHLPAVQSLAAQISSTLKSAQVYSRALEHQKAEHELALAGEIQARFLPKALPEVSGWQLAVTLVPARQTSGDFYDVIPLPNGRLGLLVADVADKGTAAALFMALSRTLVRTYAVEHHTRPDFALRVANNRILTDTAVDLFVTLFYGVLDPVTGTFVYCNAGHNPPFLLRNGDTGTVEKLTRTGLPLGIFSGGTWEQRSVQLSVGDVLVLYTDGVTETQDHNAIFFGEERLLDVLRAHLDKSAQEIQSALMMEIQSFTKGAPQYDDIALMILVRKE